MKRLLWIALAALLLVGCSGKKNQRLPTESTGATVTQPTEPGGFYQPNSTIEQQTGGAVRVYALESGGWFGLRSLGVNLLLTGENKMLVLTGEKGVSAAEATVSGIGTSTILDTFATGVAYYEPDTRRVVILNPQLQKVSYLTLPDTLAGMPVVSLVRNEVYYSTGSEVRAMNMSTGISRLLRQTAGLELQPKSYFEGNMLACQMQGSDGEFQMLYISSETGQTLSEEQGIFRMETGKDRYFLWKMDGLVQQMVFGAQDTEAQSFSAPLPNGTRNGFVAVPAINGVVSYGETEEGLSLFYYDLGTGKKTAQLVLPEVKSFATAYTDGTYVWVLAGEESQCLYRWNVSQITAEDETVYTGAFYTAQNPDIQGLKECKALADSYSKQFGVKLTVWQDAVKTTGGYAVTAEHQPQVLNGMLKKLEPVLAQFPKNFLLKTVEAGWIQIRLVREIEGDRDWVHFWESGDCHILISAQGNVGQSLIQGVAYAIDSHVLGNSRDFDFDRWNPLNPAGFTYANSYELQVKQEYLEGDTRAFTDELGASYIHEDRCGIFYHAMLTENAAMFQAPIMQAKLKRLCMGIREAYGLQKSAEIYPWEQYLDTPIAYVKK